MNWSIRRIEKIMIIDFLSTKKDLIAFKKPA